MEIPWDKTIQNLLEYGAIGAISIILLYFIFKILHSFIDSATQHRQNYMKIVEEQVKVIAKDREIIKDVGNSVVDAIREQTKELRGK